MRLQQRNDEEGGWRVNCRGGEDRGSEGGRQGKEKEEDGGGNARGESARRKRRGEKADGGEQKGESWAVERFGSC